MSSIERFEYKYRLHLSEYFAVRNALTWATRPDEYTMAAARRRYFVRSLYFDAPGYPAYVAKLSGLSERVKLRIRSYGAHAGHVPFVKYEIKTRRAARVGKVGARVALVDHFAWMHSPPSDPADPLLGEFFRRRYLAAQNPVVLVDYNREALTMRGGEPVRITFDHGLRFAAADELFPARANFVRPYPNWVVMEVKTAAPPPSWLERLVRCYELKSLPNSKYALAIEHTQNEIFRY